MPRERSDSAREADRADRLAFAALPVLTLGLAVSALEALRPVEQEQLQVSGVDGGGLTRERRTHPEKMDEMMADKDPAKRERVMKAMLQMKKLELSELEKAYRG